MIFTTDPNSPQKILGANMSVFTPGSAAVLCLACHTN